MSIFKKTVGVGVVTLGIALAPMSAFSEEPTWTNGVVKKIDPAQSKVTVKHDAITNLDMPSMTMIFFVPDKEVLGKIKEGDAKQFAFGDQFGRMVIEDVK